MLPEDGLWKTETCQSLHCTYMIFNFFGGFKCVTVYRFSFWYDFVH
jgi:hypothetical protein